ncbi:hypothetical protein IU470_25065 [Nocardia abscessus]|uniref:Uncharacterized protein n=1 Tax=Nocardia abscessus TaxID=120957 RepID=A0ABS0CDD6_9NOCA|nr:hypothetical protein [Nocardia abscessus]MBF6228368.1 hypothetical protein [Nocardia abscessus]
MRILLAGWLLRATPYLHALLVGRSIRLDTGKAERELGWSPAYPTYREGLSALGAAPDPAERSRPSRREHNVLPA